MKKRTLALVLSSVLAMSVLTACGGSKESAPAPEASTEQEKPQEEAPAEKEEPQAEVQEAEEADEEESEGFSLLDVDESMIDIGVYGNDSNGTELVFSMFTGPDGEDYVSLFGFDNNSNSGDVICGTYEAETETDDEGYDWTYFSVNDVYTGQSFELGVGEDAENEKVVFFDREGNVVEGTYLTEEETINYMASAVNVLGDADGAADGAASGAADSSEFEDAKAAIAAELSVGYAGASDAGEELYWAVDPELTKGLFAVKAADGSVDGLIGDVVDNGDGSVTITDFENGNSSTIQIETITDDAGEECFKLTAEDGTIGVVYECDAKDVIDVVGEL